MLVFGKPDQSLVHRLQEENRHVKEELMRRMQDLEKLTKALTAERDDLVC